MNAKEWAEKLSGRSIGEEITREEERQAKEDGMLILFGASDDLIEIAGIFRDEIGAYGGKTIYLDRTGVFREPDYHCLEVPDCPFLKEAREKRKKIYGFYDGVWKFETDVPHETFCIWEEDEGLFCMGIVISGRDDL